ncbi:MAG: phage tail tape measure protein, partial [Acidobacteria bacterium]|nr:phage tail tape measure protein [Acidobacteriota bacterium]
MPDDATKTALSLNPLGRSGKELLPLLNLGGAGLREMRQEASEFGRVIDERTFRAAEHFRDNLTRLRGAVEGLAFNV